MTAARRRGFDSRATVGLRAPRSVSHNVTPSRGGAAVHYMGVRFVASSHEDCRRTWRGIQAHHMAPGGLGAANGSADVGYSAAVCPHGIVLAGRGWGVRPAAQGTAAGNLRFLAVCGLIGPNQQPTREMREAIAWTVAEWRRLGAGMQVRPHSWFRATSCPGPLAALAAELHQTRISTEEEDEMAWDEILEIPESTQEWFGRNWPTSFPNGRGRARTFLISGYGHARSANGRAGQALAEAAGARAEAAALRTAVQALASGAGLSDEQVADLAQRIAAAGQGACDQVLERLEAAGRALADGDDD